MVPPADKLQCTATASPTAPMPTPATPDQLTNCRKSLTNTWTPAAGATNNAMDKIEPTAGIATTILAHNNPNVTPSTTANHHLASRTETANATGSK